MTAYSVAITPETRHHTTIYDVVGALHISTFTEIVKCLVVVVAASRKPLEK